MFDVTLSIPYGGGMKICIGSGHYPDVARALQEEGATIVDTIEQAEGFVFTQTPGGSFPELHAGITWV